MVAKGAWIKVDTTADALALLAGVSPKQVIYAVNKAHKTLARTINKTIRAEVRDKYAIKAGDFKRPALSHEETAAALSLRYRGARLSLSRFNPVQRGVQVMAVLDVSTSMLAEDVKPNRLERAKLAIEELMTGLAGRS